MTEEQLDELFPEMTLNPNPRVRKKCLVVYFRKKGYRREEVAELLRIDEDTVTNYTKKYDESGLAGLLEENYHHPTITALMHLQQALKLCIGRYQQYQVAHKTGITTIPVSYTHLRAHETDSYLVCRL